MTNPHHAKKRKSRAPRVFDIGDSAQLITFENLPKRHKEKDYYLNNIQDNPIKMLLFGKRVTISNFEFYASLGEWLYRIKEDYGQCMWTEDMFVLPPVIPKEKGKNIPQMPNL